MLTVHLFSIVERMSVFFFSRTQRIPAYSIFDVRGIATGAT